MKQRLPGGNKPHKNTLKTAVKLLFFLFLISILSLFQVQANFEKVVIGNFDCVCFFLYKMKTSFEKPGCSLELCMEKKCNGFESYCGRQWI